METYQLLFDLLRALRTSYHLIPMVGIELECYLSDICQAREACSSLSCLTDACALSLTKESGYQQFELRTTHTTRIPDLIYLIHQSKTLLKRRLQYADFRAKPSSQEPGNAFHINLSFLDLEGCAISFKQEGRLTQQMSRIMGGLLFCLPYHMIYFAPNADSYERFRHPDIHTPTKICWGYHNRTAALRVHLPSNQDGRLEHRIPCADSSLLPVINAILVGAVYGMSRYCALPKPLYGLSSDAQYSLQNLPLSLEAALNSYLQGGAEILRTVRAVLPKC